MLPEWMSNNDQYLPDNNGSDFVIKSIKSIGKVLSQIQIQKGHEKKRTLPPLLKLILMFLGVLLISVTQNKIIMMTYSAIILLYVSFWPANDLLRIIKSSLIASIMATIILFPAIIIHHSLMMNEFIIIIKVFLCVLTLNIFNHTTQWNHITVALRKIHIPGLFVFIIDITLKYIVLLGNLINDLLTSLQLRSVGTNNKEYTSIGGVMGVTFIRATEMNQQMYEAMLCRGFTDDYKGL